MSSIGSGLFSRLSRNSVRELLSSGGRLFLAYGLWNFEPREHLSSTTCLLRPIFYDLSSTFDLSSTTCYANTCLLPSTCLLLNIKLLNGAQRTASSCKWGSKNCQFVNSIFAAFESLPTETSCRSGNCARILVSKLSESGNTTFSAMMMPHQRQDAARRMLYFIGGGIKTSPPFLLLIVPSKDRPYLLLLKAGKMPEELCKIK
jgi:hypothetical protein